jgi:anaerobic selenocysteine-containing dehydrogenase
LSSNPWRTGTVKHADEWVLIVPGTGALVPLAIVNTLVAERRQRTNLRRTS